MSAVEPKTDRELLIVIDGKLDSIINDCTDHEKRIRDLEGNQNKFIGAVVTISAVMGIIGSRISAFLFGGS